MSVTRRKLTRKHVSEHRVSLAGKPRACSNFFLDSGAHSLYTLHVIEKGHSEGYSWYHSPEFRKYVDEYAAFVKAHDNGIDWYANVDAIFNPQLSWEVLKYLEDEHGLKPVPVIHFGTPWKWFQKHLDAGYEFVGVGGLGQEATKGDYKVWADLIFSGLCPKSNGHLPLVRTHGFAMTSYSLMIRYPWWSVDSASWAKAAGFGSVFVPHKRNGKFDFSVPPYVIGFSFRSETAKVFGKHYLTLGKAEQRVVLDWLAEIDIPLGKMSPDGVPVEYGVLSQYNARAAANLKFYDRLCKWIPPWPWAFKVTNPGGFF